MHSVRVSLSIINRLSENARHFISANSVTFAAGAVFHTKICRSINYLIISANAHVNRLYLNSDTEGL